MRRGILTTGFAGCCLLMLNAVPASTSDAIRDAWLTSYPDVCTVLETAAYDCSLCHSGGLNPYGTDLAANDPYVPTSIDGLDSDQDGRTNGEEINNDCTLPGDGTSDIEAASWTQIKTLFR